MSSGFVKIYTTILDSSIWEEELHVRVVWLALLALADSRGMVEASVTGLTRRANVTREQCADALARLMAPDPNSKSPENEGRRIEVVERGWHILNYRTYRERGSSTERVRRYRAKGNADSVTRETSETPALPLLLGSSSTSERKKAKRDVTAGNGPLAIGEMVQKILGLKRTGEWTPGSGAGTPYIPLAEVEKLGADVARAFKAVGGGARFLAATGKDYSFLAREFGQALTDARAATSHPEAAATA